MAKQHQTKNKVHLFPVWIQSIISALFIGVLYLFLLGVAKFYFRYQLINLKDIRKQFKAIRKQNKHHGLLICPNHLTFIDSPLIMWALASPLTYMRHFFCCPWNLPKRSHVKQSRFFRVVCYLGKCILFPDDRPEQVKSAMQKMVYLLNKGQYLMIFPEGTRSSQGRVNTDEFGYGVGQLLVESPKTHTLCVYIRANAQQKSSQFPAKGSKIHIDLEMIHPQSSETRPRAAARDISRQIIQTLSNMEQKHFAKYSKQ